MNNKNIGAKISRKERKLRQTAEKHQQRRQSETYYAATQWQLMRRRFTRNKLAVVGLVVLVLMYLIAIFCEFVAPYDPNQTNASIKNQQPQMIRFYSEKTGFSFRPFVYGMKQTYHPVTMKTIYVENPEDIQYLSFFVKGSEYKLWGLFSCGRHLFGVEGSEQPVTLFGADSMGRDIFSRICYGARISCSIGLVGVFLSFILGVLIGGLSGYIGGKLDSFIQRVIDFIVCLPTLPIWMALSAAIPSDWSVTKTYFCMVLILSLMGWPGLARVVRSKFISLGNEDFIRAARVAGAGTGRIIFRHMVPSFASYLIAQITLSIPGMILGETSMSFLGLGLRSPAVSWGILLSDAQNIRNVALYPWTLIPGIFVVLTVMAFNFMGDGLRDAADPYS